MQQGQITLDSILGKYIYDTVKKENIKTIVDIGTWNGNGSTYCIYKAILDSKKKEYEVFSYEINKSFYNQSKLNLLPLNNFNLIYGSLISYDELYKIKNEIIDKQHIIWLNQDLLNIKQAPYVFNNVPDKIDLCIMDGGEFSGWLEFKKLWHRCKIIVLDDTNSYKHNKSKKFILHNLDKFKIINNSINDRNGFLIVENIII